MRTPGVWVTRPEPGNGATAAALRSAGFDALVIPILEVQSTVPGGFPPAAWPDWVLFVSANAVRSLEDAGQAVGFPPGSRSGVRVAAVGARTAVEAGARGWRVQVVPTREHAEGLLEALTTADFRGRRVWIPAGNREGSAVRLLPDSLEKRGAEVSVLPVYETMERMLTPADCVLLDAAEAGAIVLHSPSAVEAVFSDGATAAARRWHSADLVTIGPATSRRCREMGRNRLFECSVPSDLAVIAVVASRFVPERNDS